MNLSEQDAVRQVVEARRVAWNAQDIKAYRALLTQNAELTSATGRVACGREEILRLYVEQREGAYRDASLPSTVVTRIAFEGADVAFAEAEFILADVRAADGESLPRICGINSYRLVREDGKWLIASMRGIPQRSIGC